LQNIEPASNAQNNPRINNSQINRPAGLAVNPNTNKIYVSNSDSNTVTAETTDTYKFLADITVGKKPGMIAINPNTNLIYVVNSLGNTVSVIDGSANTRLH
jgi:YVTN family beta-propeller protein